MVHDFTASYTDHKIDGKNKDWLLRENAYDRYDRSHLEIEA